MSSKSVESWIAALPREDEFPLASPSRRFGGGEGHEDDYVRQFVVDERYEAALGRGLERVLSAADVAYDGPALELGCGTGILTRSLVQQPFASFVITDMSPVFLRATRDSLVAPRGLVDYVLLDAIERVPTGAFSLIALRYVLHHVLDWREFLRVAATKLQPGGVLLLEEPCSDGYLLQLMLIDLALHEHADDVSAQVRSELTFFCDTLNFYLRTDVDKSSAEDKHLFRDSTVRALLTEAGLHTRLYSNHGLDTLGASPHVGPEYFRYEFRHNLAGNFGFGAETLAFFDERIEPALSRLATLSPDEMGPLVKGVFVAQRPRHGSLEAGKALLRGHSQTYAATRHGYRALSARVAAARASMDAHKR